MSSLHTFSAAELSAKFASRDLSPLDVARDVLKRIGRWEPHIHAFWIVDAEGAMAQAEASQARWLKGAPLSPIDGVPVSIKENIATKGVATPVGSAATVLVPAPADAPPAARLREAGAVIIGKTTMPDLGMLSSGLSSLHGITRNPWDVSKNPGGSSSGAAAAGAALCGPLHLGTDIGGSVRLPAGWTGLVALKPSLGRIPIHPPYAGRVAGPMTRTVEDAALMMAALARPDARDTMSLPHQDIAWSRLDRDVRGCRIALWMDAGWGLPAEPEVRAAIEAAARAFESAGATVVPVAPFIDRAVAEGLDTFWRMRAWLDISAQPAAQREKTLPFIREWARGGANATGEQVFRGYSQMGVMRDAAVAAMQGFDFMLSPVAPLPAFDAELPCPTNDPARPFEHIAYTLPFNMSEQPAASVNAGYTASGLPIGLQIVGHRHDDLGVLQMARAWERMRPAQRPWPEPRER